MTEYLIAFNDEWVPDFTLDELRKIASATWPVIDEMKAAGVFVFTGGALDTSTAIFSVDPTSGEAVFSDGPYVETKEHLGGFVIIDAPDDEAARHWAERVALACTWPQEVHRFPDDKRFRDSEQAEATV